MGWTNPHNQIQLGLFVLPCFIIDHNQSIIDTDDHQGMWEAKTQRHIPPPEQSCKRIILLFFIAEAVISIRYDNTVFTKVSTEMWDSQTGFKQAESLTRLSKPLLCSHFGLWPFTASDPTQSQGPNFSSLNCVSNPSKVKVSSISEEKIWAWKHWHICFWSLITLIVLLNWYFKCFCSFY